MPAASSLLGRLVRCAMGARAVLECIVPAGMAKLPVCRAPFGYAGFLSQEGRGG